MEKPIILKIAKLRLGGELNRLQYCYRYGFVPGRGDRWLYGVEVGISYISKVAYVLTKFKVCWGTQ